ncbi:MAG: cation diffusion facilitator family transporter [Methanotrichaceae archaeon]
MTHDNHMHDEHTYDKEHVQDHESHCGHGHVHGIVDPSLLATRKGITTAKWSLAVLLATALIQMVVTSYSGSVALLAETIHNFGHVATTIPLWIAFSLAHRRSSKQFTYGYGRIEDLAGLAIVLIILISVIITGYESIDRLFHPQAVSHLFEVALAALIGFLGNEAMAVYRCRVGNEINSAALVADGCHARVDGLASLAVFLGAIGVWMGYSWMDPFIGIIITVVILCIVWNSAKVVFCRLIDGVEPDVVDEVKEAAGHVAGVKEVTDVRVRWLGHQLHAEINLAVSDDLSVKDGHEIAKEVRHQLMHHLSYMSGTTIHIDPLVASGEEHHIMGEHAHGDIPIHLHL